MTTRNTKRTAAATAEPSPIDDATLDVANPNFVENLAVTLLEQLKGHIATEFAALRQEIKREIYRQETIDDDPFEQSPTSPVSPTPSEDVSSSNTLPFAEGKIIKPKKFDGKHSEFLSFMTQCEIAFEMAPKSFSTDQRKVLFIIANLEGNALRWAQEVFTDKEHPHRRDYRAFRKSSYSLYDNHVYHRDAEDRLLSLKQTKSASAYAVEFQTLAAAVGYDEKARCGIFFHGLKRPVQTAIMQQGQAKTFEALRDQAVHFDQHQHRMRVEERKEEKEPEARRRDAKTPHKSTVEKDPSNPADEPRKRKFTSRDEYEKWKALRPCSKCSKRHTGECKAYSQQNDANHPAKKHKGNSLNTTAATPMLPLSDPPTSSPIQSN